MAAYWIGDRGIQTAFPIFFLSGMLIFPLAMLVEKIFFKRGKPSPDNPMGRVALESTIAMIGGFFAAWLFLPIKPELVFPLCALAVGTHYFPFRTAYGDWHFWLLGGLIAVAAMFDIYNILGLAGKVPILVAVIEIAYGTFLTMRSKAV